MSETGIYGDENCCSWRGAYGWLPRDIEGELINDGVKWHFSINAAATAEWRNSNERYFFGCDKKECDELFLLPLSLMAG